MDQELKLLSSMGCVELFREMAQCAAIIIYVAVPGRKRTLFCRVFQSHPRVQSGYISELPLRAGLILAM